MFQAELRPAKVIKQVVDALKEVVTEITLECTATEMLVQAMDSSHVSLVSLQLLGDKFQSYRCEKNMTLGVHVGNLAKLLKCAGNDDTVQLRAEEGGDALQIRISDLTEERVSSFSMKLIEIEQEALGIPQQEYKVAVQMPSSEYSRVIKDLANIGDAIHVEVDKSSVAFSTSGDIGQAKMRLKGSVLDPAAAQGPVKEEPKVVKEEAKVKEEPKGDGLVKVKIEGEKPAKAAPQAAEPKDSKAGVKQEPGAEKATITDDDAGDANGEPSAKRRRKGADKEALKEADQVRIACEEPCSLQFALRYLAMFAKAQPLSDTVRLRMAKDVPLQVEFDIQRDGGERMGGLRYYLAPKVGDVVDGDDEN
eukprot:TRINITY_DN444_c0_g2_i1.p1 TRINITY_DN444_c0_g2~~TRINITY_DN444_c0_g2_i1.p1  ORF type:complete len:364 (+),score=172.91 TRINITY_DN444_c0_g2_i1:104-1195(+)